MKPIKRTSNSLDYLAQILTGQVKISSPRLYDAPSHNKENGSPQAHILSSHSKSRIHHTPSHSSEKIFDMELQDGAQTKKVHPLDLDSLTHDSTLDIQNYFDSPHLSTSSSIEGLDELAATTSQTTILPETIQISIAPSSESSQQNSLISTPSFLQSNNSSGSAYTNSLLNASLISSNSNYSYTSISSSVIMNGKENTSKNEKQTNNKKKIQTNEKNKNTKNDKVKNDGSIYFPFFNHSKLNPVNTKVPTTNSSPELNTENHFLSKSSTQPHMEDKIKTSNIEYIYKDGSVYQGEMDILYRKHGKGTLFLHNGDIFDGTFINDLKHGPATCKYVHHPNGIDTLSAVFEYDEICTSFQAIVLYSNGDKYCGTVKPIKEEVSACSGTNSSGTSPCGTDANNFEGKNFQPTNPLPLPLIHRHGNGELHFNNGDKYYGLWRHDKQNGFGVMMKHYAESNNNTTNYNSSNKKSSWNLEQMYGNWVDGKMEGHGLVLNVDGTIFEGIFKQGMKNGDGKLKLSNGDMLIGTWKNNQIKKAVFEKGPLQQTALCTQIIMKEQLNGLLSNGGDMQFSHPESILPSKTKLMGEKWKDLFVTFKSIIEEEKKNFQQTTVYQMFKDKQHKGGNVSPTSYNSLTQHLNQYVEDSLSSGTLAILVTSFVNIFSWRFHSIDDHSAKFQLPHALDDYFSYIFHLQDTLLYLLEDVGRLVYGYQAKELIFLLKNIVMKRIYKLLFAIYTRNYAEQDENFKFKLLALQRVTLKDLGAKEAYIPLPKQLFDEPYKSAIQTLKSLSNCYCQMDKFKSMIETHVEINNCCEFSEMMSGHGKKVWKRHQDFSADDVMPVYLYIFIKANIPHLWSEYQFLKDFEDEQVSRSEMSYRFAYFQNAIQFVQDSAYHLRDQNNVLVPMSLFEMQLADVVQQIMDKRSGQDLPRFTWISNLLIEIGSCAPSLAKGSRYTLQCTQLFDQIQKQFEHVKQILQVVRVQIIKEEELASPKVIKKNPLTKSQGPTTPILFDQQEIQTPSSVTSITPTSSNNNNNTDTDTEEEIGSESDDEISWTTEQSKIWKRKSTSQPKISYSVLFEQTMQNFVFYRLASKLESFCNKGTFQTDE